MDIPIVVSLVATSIALFSAVIALRGLRTAREALRLNKIEFGERHEKLKPYIIEGLIYQESKTYDLVVFALSFINGANAPNSITQLNLKVHAFDGYGSPTHLVLTPIDQPALVGLPWKLSPLCLPMNLAPRTTSSGWTGFKLPRDFECKVSIDRYELIGLTTSGSRVTVDSYLLRRVTNAPATE